MIVGLFVGGRGRRMGGVDKSALATREGPTILERIERLVGELGLPLVLVGEGAHASALPRIADDPGGVGPIGGLSALLAHAGNGQVIALACDMPYVTADDLRALAEHPSKAAVLAAKTDLGWEPLFARYDAPRVRPIAHALITEGRRALHAVIEQAGAEVFHVGDPQTLRDWDTPEDCG